LFELNRQFENFRPDRILQHDQINFGIVPSIALQAYPGKSFPVEGVLGSMLDRERSRAIVTSDQIINSCNALANSYEVQRFPANFSIKYGGIGRSLFPEPNGPLNCPM